jgi:DNA-3-methyladenine glycosylase I
MIFMGEKNLKEIFDLMYKKLSELAIGDGFFKWINELRNVTFNDIKNKGDSFLFEKLILTIFSGGFRAKVVDAKWSNIRKAFDDFDVCKIASYDEEKISQIINTPNIIKNIPKIKATVNNAKKVVELQKRCNSFAGYIGSFEDPLILANDLVEKFDFLGRETVWDFLKLIGFEAIKPDIHVRRILFRLGLISDWRSDPKITEEVFVIAKKISEATGERLGVIDAVLWFYGADRPKEIKKPICGQKTFCNECYLTKFCKYYQNKKNMSLLKFI